MEDLKYEDFVRGAFGNVERGEDPAHLANQDYIRNKNDFALNKAKAAVAYSIAIYNNKFFEEQKVCDAYDFVAMNDYLVETFNVKSYSELEAIINVYNAFMREVDFRDNNRKAMRVDVTKIDRPEPWGINEDKIDSPEPWR